MVFAVFFCVFLHVLPASSLIDAPLGKPSHALVWASEPYAKGVSGKVSYKTQTVTSFVTSLFSSLLRSPTAVSDIFENEILKQMPPQVVLVAVGQQMREKAELDVQNAALQKLTSEARSWISVPHLLKDDVPGLHIVEQLLETYANFTLGRSYIAGDCDAEVQGSVVYPSDAKHLQGGVPGAVEFLKGLHQTTTPDAGNSPVMMLVCLPKEDAQVGEAEAVDSLDNALRSSGERYVAVYTAEPEAPAEADKELQTRRRSMLQYADPTDSPTAGPINGDDDLFLLQVDLLRALLVVVFTVTALLSGMCCLMSLDTPTRFESTRAEGGAN